MEIIAIVVIDTSIRQIHSDNGRSGSHKIRSRPITAIGTTSVAVVGSVAVATVLVNILEVVLRKAVAVTTTTKVGRWPQFALTSTLSPLEAEKQQKLKYNHDKR